MSLHQNFSRNLLGLLLFSITFSGYSAVDSESKLTVVGKVTRGTCAFALADQTVNFSQSLLANNVAGIGEREDSKIPFSVKYSCQEFEDETPDMEVIIKAGTGTEITGNKISPTTNTTNASFVIYDCKESNCSLINFNAGTSSVDFETGNGSKNKDFQVEVVKKDTAEVKAGSLKAILALTLIQP